MPEIQSRKSGADAAGASRLHATANWACFLFGVACLGLGVGRLWQSNIPGASLGLGAGLLLVFAATVDRFDDGCAAGADDLIADGLRPLSIAIGQHDAESVFCQHSRSGSPDGAGAAGDERNLHCPVLTSARA